MNSDFLKKWRLGGTTRTSDKKTLAAENGNVIVYALIMENVEDKNPIAESHAFQENPVDIKETPLHLAAKHGQRNQLRSVLDYLHRCQDYLFYIHI